MISEALYDVKIKNTKKIRKSNNLTNRNILQIIRLNKDIKIPINFIKMNTDI